MKAGNTFPSPTQCQDRWRAVNRHGQYTLQRPDHPRLPCRHNGACGDVRYLRQRQRRLLHQLRGLPHRVPKRNGHCELSDHHQPRERPAQSLQGQPGQTAVIQFNVTNNYGGSYALNLNNLDAGGVQTAATTWPTRRTQLGPTTSLGPARTSIWRGVRPRTQTSGRSAW